MPALIWVHLFINAIDDMKYKEYSGAIIALCTKTNTAVVNKSNYLEYTAWSFICLFRFFYVISGLEYLFSIATT